MGWIGNSNLRFTNAKEVNRVEFFMIHVIMIEEIMKIGTDQIAEIGEFNLVDKGKVDQGMNKIIGEEILEVMCMKMMD